MMAESPHSELINTLTEFYTLLDTLAAVPPNSSHLPPHAPGVLNSVAAISAGYAADTVELLSALPYLNGDLEMEWELLPSTFPITYLGVENFEWSREMLHDEVMPPTAVRLTRSAIYGLEYIYDTETKLLVPWRPIDNPDEVDNYYHVQGASPREVLGEVIDDYRRLNYLGTPDGVDFNYPLFSESGGQPPQDWEPKFQRQWRAQYDVWAATRKLKDLYIECGWDVDAVQQPGFRRDEFIVKRESYWRDVVEPLKEIEGIS